jgi:anaerobic ribonucleoside-triphosphate reductase activating protein
MNYSGLNTTDIANGPGVRVTLFVSGCNLKCKGCWNPEAWDFNHGNKYTNETEEDILDAVSKPYIKGFSLLGGEPYNQESTELVSLVSKLKERHPEKDIWIWTGYEFNEIRNHPLTKYIDVAVCGRFIMDQRDISANNPWRGSRNQRIVLVQDSLKNGKTVLMPDIPNNSI